MKPFVIGDKRFAFDVTNADDLRRLEKAYSILCAQNDGLTEACGETRSASEQMQTIFGMYHDFFETLFPGRSAEIVGEEPSVGQAGRAFDRWTAYLRGCVEEEQRNDRMMRRIYLGEATAGAAEDVGVADTETV